MEIEFLEAWQLNEKIFSKFLLTIIVFIGVFWIADFIFGELGFWQILLIALIASGILTPIREYIDRK